MFRFIFLSVLHLTDRLFSPPRVFRTSGLSVFNGAPFRDAVWGTKSNPLLPSFRHPVSFPRSSRLPQSDQASADYPTGFLHLDSCFQVRAGRRHNTGCFEPEINDTGVKRRRLLWFMMSLSAVVKPEYQCLGLCLWLSTAHYRRTRPCIKTSDLSVHLAQNNWVKPVSSINLYVPVRLLHHRWAEVNFLTTCTHLVINR